MAFCRSVFPILLLCAVSSFAVNVPVFLWGDLAEKTLKSNPLSTVSALEFNKILQSELEDDPFTVIFIEETLSVEDFSSKNSEGESSFPYLRHQLKNSLYLPNVDDAPVELQNLALSENADHMTMTDKGLSAELGPKSDDRNLLYIKLMDAREGESRSDMLRRHDGVMADIVSNLRERGQNRIVAIYTANNPSWTVSHSRQRRQASNGTSDYIIDGLRLYANNIHLDNGKTSMTLSGFTPGESLFNDTTMNSTLNFQDNSITLNFYRSQGYWFFDKVTLKQTAPDAVTEDLHPVEQVFALMGFSYRCAQNVSFVANVNDTNQYTLTFEDLKIQPFFETTNGTQDFGDSFNCVGFFSAPIWASLFVVFILLSITFYGIMMMMDIRTMDRFDDPKGKTITINAAE